jgi:predicted dehydrogenase
VTEQGKPITKANVVEGKEGLGPLAGDHVQATYQFANGVTGYFASKRNQAGTPSRFGLQVFGSKGVVEHLSGYQEQVNFLADPSWSPGRSGKTWQKVTSAGIDQPEPLKGRGLHDGNVAAVKDLLSAIETKREPLCGVQDARLTIEMIMAVFESQRLGRPVTFPLENRQHPLTML